MTIEKIIEQNEKLSTTVWINKKNRVLYEIVGIAYDATNSRDSNLVVVYKKVGPGYGLFVRDFDEFTNKFDTFYDVLT